MSSTGLAVLESRWWDDGNHSVRPLFETLSGIATGNPFDFRYDMFADRGSLEALMGQVCGADRYHSIYLAAHGDANSIQAAPGANISRAIFRNCMRAANGAHRVTGIYLGSCLICNEDNAFFFLDPQLGCNVNWIAGYSRSVDWVDSSSIDMIFWSKVLNHRAINKRRRRGKISDLEVVRRASDDVKRLMPTVFEQMGFNLYFLDAGQDLARVW